MKRARETGFAELSRSVPATIGVAVAAVDGTPLASFGSWSTGVAWSTIKVPLAIAAVRAGVGSHELVAAVITESDNAAAEELWSRLGEPAEAARQVRGVIDDPATVVESRRVRPDYTAFGQTQWSLGRQAQFAARLPHIPDASPVVDLMRNLCTDHRWGLAAKGFAAKGGWGPGIADGYLVRQFAVVPVADGHIGVALAAEVDDGVFETGVGVLDDLADWFVDDALTQY